MSSSISPLRRFAVTAAASVLPCIPQSGGRF
jgi:hypothetical protein